MPPARLFALLALPLLFAGCSLFIPDAYVPSSAGKNWGYADAPVTADTLEIGYIGLENFTDATTHQFATFRAAELTLQAGKPCFAILGDRHSIGRRIVEVETTTTDAFGNMTDTWETETDYYPIDTLLIRMLDTPGPGTFDAADLLHQAQQKGVHLAPMTLAFLAAAPSTESAPRLSTQKN